MSTTGFQDYLVSCAKGDVIFNEGDLGTEMYIIQTGSVAVDKDIKGQNRRLAVFGKGDFFGEMALLENLPRTASVTALEDCEVVRIDSATFDTMIRSNIEIAVRMLRKFSVRVREADKKIELLLGDFPLKSSIYDATPQAARTPLYVCDNWFLFPNRRPLCHHLLACPKT